jgi:hypothetical protein
MNKIHINFSSGGNWDYKQKINSESATSSGGFDKSINYNQKSFDEDFTRKNQKILNLSRGSGYWIWKPYIILDALKKSNYGDIIFYSDSGSIIIKNFKPMFEIVEKDEKGIILYELNVNFLNKYVTKRDCFFYMNCDEEYYHNSVMTLASFVLIRKSDYSISFVEEWLKYCEDERILTDIPNQCGLDNFEGFSDHRHDQSVLSLLARKNKITIEVDPSEYGNDRRDPNNQLINHTR